MSLEWSNLTECFTSPLKDLSMVNVKNTTWTNYDQGLLANPGIVNNSNNSNNSNNFNNGHDLEIPNLALVEDAFRQVVNHEHQNQEENQFVYQQQYDLTNKGNSLDFPSLEREGEGINYSRQTSQENDYNDQYTISSPYSPKLIIKSDDIRQQIRNLAQSDQQNGSVVSQLPHNITNRQGIPKKNDQKVNISNNQNLSPTIIPKANQNVIPISNMSNREEENRWLIVLIIFITLFLLLSL